MFGARPRHSAKRVADRACVSVFAYSSLALLGRIMEPPDVESYPRNQRPTQTVFVAEYKGLGPYRRSKSVDAGAVA